VRAAAKYLVPDGKVDEVGIDDDLVWRTERSVVLKEKGGGRSFAAKP
jgi:hypothetical protein